MSWSELERLVDEAEVAAGLRRSLKGCRSTPELILAARRLGYRITRADAEAGTVSATRLTGLRLAATVEERSRNQTIVRANASVLALGRETQVDDPNFYQANFFVPLGNTMARNLMVAPPDGSGPAAPRPVAERLPGQRQAPAASGEPPPARP